MFGDRAHLDKLLVVPIEDSGAEGSRGTMFLYCQPPYCKIFETFVLFCEISPGFSVGEDDAFESIGNGFGSLRSRLEGGFFGTGIVEF